MMEFDRSLIRENLDVLAVLVLGVAAFYMTFTGGLANGMWVDEGRYGIMASALSEHPLDFSTEYHGTVEKYPPVFPYLLAASEAVFGFGDVSIHMVSPIMLLLTIGIAYLFGRIISGRRTGVIAAALTAVSPVLVFVAARVLMGSTLTALYAASLLLLYYAFADRTYSKYATYALVPVMALAMLTKQPAYALGPVFLIYVFYKEGLDVLRSPMEYRPLYLSIGLGVLVAAPWLIRNTMTCGIPLCELQKVMNNAASAGTGWESTDPWYYLFNLTKVLGLPLGVLAYLASAASVVDPLRRVEDWTGDRRVLVAAGLAFAGLIAAFVATKIALMLFLFAIAAIQRTDEELVLWLGIAAGIGIMNLTGIRIPRYVVFTVPVFALLTAHWMGRMLDLAAEWESVDRSTLKAAVYVITILAVAVSGLMASTNLQGSFSSYQHLDRAGYWLGQNAPGAAVMASSARQVTYYSQGRIVADMIPSNTTKVNRSLRAGEYDFVQVDLWEYTRREQVRFVLQDLIQAGVVQPVQVYRQGERPMVVVLQVTDG